MEREVRLRIAHMTDVHIQPERGAEEGLLQALEHMQSQGQPPELLLTGGDAVMKTRRRIASTRGLVGRRLRAVRRGLRRHRSIRRRLVRLPVCFVWLAGARLVAQIGDPGLVGMRFPVRAQRHFVGQKLTAVAHAAVRNVETKGGAVVAGRYPVRR